MAFCGWTVGRTPAIRWRPDVKVWAEAPENIPLNTPVAVQIGFEGDRALTETVQTTLLGAKMTGLHRLPASFFVSVSYMCWAHRHHRMIVRGEEVIYE